MWPAFSVFMWLGSDNLKMEYKSRNMSSVDTLTNYKTFLCVDGYNTISIITMTSLFEIL